MTEDSATCPICGDTFDEERWMKIHKTKAHDQDSAQISDEELLNELIRLGEKSDMRAPTCPLMDSEGEYCHGTYIGRFGSWNGAVKAAGFVPNNDIPDEDLLDEIRRLDEMVEGAPTKSDMNELGEFASGLYHGRFGSWSAAVIEAGVTPAQNIPKSDLVEELQSLGEELGRTPMRSDLSLGAGYSDVTFWRKFGSWTEALRVAGFEPNLYRNLTDTELLDEIHRLKDVLDKTPSIPDMKAYGKYSTKPYKNRWGTWRAALGAAGYEVNQPSGEDHPRWLGGVHPYGPGWTSKKKEQVRERDGRKCQHCGRGEHEHIDMFGQKHTVHHIRKARWIDDPHERNHVDNLITLCKGECHWTWEAMSPLRPIVGQN